MSGFGTSHPHFHISQLAGPIGVVEILGLDFFPKI